MIDDLLNSKSLDRISLKHPFYEIFHGFNFCHFTVDIELFGDLFPEENRILRVKSWMDLEKYLEEAHSERVDICRLFNILKINFRALQPSIDFGRQVNIRLVHEEFLAFSRCLKADFLGKSEIAEIVSYLVVIVRKLASK